jgi:hypothetical protein
LRSESVVGGTLHPKRATEDDGTSSHCDEVHRSGRCRSLGDTIGKDEVMLVVGVLAQFEVHPELEAEVAPFFEDGLAIVNEQPPSTTWFAFRIGPTTCGAFAVFACEEDRADLLSRGGPTSSREHAELFAQPPTFDLVDLLEVRRGTIGHT